MPELNPFEPLRKQIAKLKTAPPVKGSRMSWGTVTQTNPLRVVEDGPSDQVNGTPDTLVPILVVGERVQLMRSGTSLTVVAVAERPQQLEGTTAQREALQMAAPEMPASTTFYDTDEGKQYGWDIGTTTFVVRDVAEAQAIAEQAAEDALLAKTTADGRNRIFVGTTTPTADPDAPFVQGDLWYRTVLDAGVERFAGVQIWNGTEWKEYRFVANSVLVPGSVGPVLIEDGAVTAEKMNASFFYGREFFGSKFTGGIFTMTNRAEQELKLDAIAAGASSTAPWRVWTPTGGTVNVGTAPNWTTVFTYPANGQSGFEWSATRAPIGYGSLLVSFQIRSSITQSLWLYYGDDQTEGVSLVANVTKTVNLSVPWTNIDKPIGLYPAGPTSGAHTLTLGYFEVHGVSLDKGKIQLGRAGTDGRAVLAVTDELEYPAVTVDVNGATVRSEGGGAETYTGPGELTFRYGASGVPDWDDAVRLHALSGILEGETEFGHMAFTVVGNLDEMEALALEGPPMYTRFQNTFDGRTYMWIGSRWAARAGTLAIATGALAQIGTSGNYSTSITLTNIPSALLEAERLQISDLQIGSGNGIVSQVVSPGGPNAGPLSATVRFMQLGNSTAQTLTLRWEVVSR